MAIWDRVASVASLFLPQVPIPSVQSAFEGQPDQARKERPLPIDTVTRWLQKDIEDAVRLADQGDLSRCAQLSRSLRRDGTLGGILSTRTSGLTRLPKQFRGTPNVVQDLERGLEDGDVGLFDKIIPSKELALLLGDGILLGVGVGELLPLPDRREKVFVRLDPEFLRYRWWEDTWYYSSIAGYLKITPGDGRWVLHTPGGYLNPWTNGLWAALSRSFVAKDHAFNYRENYSGKLANPARVAESPQAAPDEMSNRWFRKVAAWGPNQVFATKPGYVVKLLELANGTGHKVFQDTIDSSDKEFMVALAGQIVTITGGAGFANANIHATIRTDLIQDDGDDGGTTVNQQILRPEINRLYGGAARGNVAWDTKPPGDLKAEAESISACATAIEDFNRVGAAYGLKVDARELATRFKVPIVVVAQVQVPAQIGAPAANDTPEDAAGDAPPTPDAASTLADKMTQYSIDRCEHGSSNRCRLCGIERVRDFTLGDDGAGHTWSVAWKPISITGQELAS